MPRRNLDHHFEAERPEWTKRKHDLLARYVKPAAMKMRLRGGAVALVDGYAGVNSYGTETTGSTAIMVQAAKDVRAQGDSATVYACEPDKGRYQSMCTNLKDAISTGVLRPFNEPHEQAHSKILRELGSKPAIVFLDPQTVTQMTLESDILPWVERAHTDILGVFMAGQACRCCGQMISGGIVQKIPPEAYLGEEWRDGTTEDGAFNSFLGALGSKKRFKGMYRLRKLEPLRYAYGIFGLSDHADGYWLLSNAVAKDCGILKDFDFQKEKETSLFAEDESDARQRDSFESLVKIAEQTIRQHPKLVGARLAAHLFDHGIGVEELFGKYVERDFTDAARHVLGLPNGRSRAKTKRN